jgi:hypothetical protein
MTFDDQQQQRNDDWRKFLPADPAAEIVMLWASLKETWLSPEGRANTVARIEFLEGST